MPATARSLGVDPADPVANVAGGTAYLSGLMARYDGDVVKSLAAYNAGPGAVDRWRGVPPYAETRAYVAAILDRLAEQAE
jgi:soluble lytic murein transglycosylase-like protein